MHRPTTLVRFAPNSNRMTIDWPVPLQLPTLGPTDIHLWAATLESPFGHSQFIRTLSIDERRRAKKMDSRAACHQFVRGRYFLRCLLGSYLNIAPSQLIFQYNAFGKPILNPKHGKLHFNLAHSEDLAVIAICRSSSVGVDIEKQRDLDDLMAIAACYFSKGEVAALQQYSQSDRKSAFFHYWTGKEAYIKALGRGVSDNLLNKVDLSLVASNEHLYQVRQRAFLRWFSPTPRFSAALACTLRHANLVCCRWENHYSCCC